MADTQLIKQGQAGGLSGQEATGSVYDMVELPLHLVGEDTLTGSDVRVNEQSVLRSIPAMAAVLCIAEAMGALPIHLYERMQPYGKKRANDHPLYHVLHDSPNEDMSAQAFIETMLLHALLWGNAYAAIDRDTLGRPIGMFPLLPDRTAPVRDAKGNLYYLTRVAGKPYPLFAADVFHIMGPSLSGWLGINRVAKCREALGTMIAADVYASKAYGNGVHPSGSITHPKGIGPKAANNLRLDVENQHRGLSNKFKVIVLQEGAEFKPFTLDLEKTQLLESRRFSVEDAGRLWRVPSILLNHTKDSNYSIGEATMRYFITMTLKPWGKRIRSEVHRKLLRNDEQASLFAEVLYDDLLTGDFAAKVAYYRGLYEMGAITAAEIRERENLNPYADNLGSEPVVNGAYSLLSEIGAKPAPAPAPTPTPDPPADDEEDRALDYNPAHMASAKALAEQFAVDAKALRNRLDRWRRKTDGAGGGWAELTVSSPSQPQYLYRVGDVLPILRGMGAAVPARAS